MGIRLKRIRTILLAATLIGTAITACEVTSLPTGAPSISTATPPATDSPTVQAQPTTVIASTRSPTPDLAATQAALATPTEEPFHLPGGRLLIGVNGVPPEERDSIRDGWWSKYFWLGLTDGTVEPHLVLSGEYPIRDRTVALSPDYSHLAFVRQTFAGDESLIPQSTIIYLLGPDNKGPVQIAPPVAKGAGIKGITWSLDSRFVAFWDAEEWQGGNENNMHIYEVQSGALKTLSAKASYPGDPELSPNGDRVAFANEDLNPDSAGLYLINADGTDEHRLVEGAIFSPKWHPDGARLIFEQADLTVDPVTGFRHIYSYDLGSGVVTLLTPADQSSYWFVLSPDGRSLTYISEEEGVTILSVIGTDGGMPVELARGSNIGIANFWSPDSQYLAYFESGGLHITDSQGRGKVQIFQDLEIEDVIAWLP